MIKILQEQNCCGCSACVNICPKHCISMVSNSEGFKYPAVNETECISCGRCRQACPILNKKKIDENQRSPLVYAAINQNDETRMASSSGGLFTLLAERIFARGGVVYGACFSKDYRHVYHKSVTDMKALSELRGSKYVQSDLRFVYKEIKENLLQKKFVLFSGTPCQVEGLKSFLGKEHETLLCVDLICHGVPSPKVWARYVEEKEREYGAKCKKVVFRNKKYGWDKYHVSFEFLNEKIYCESLSNDPYMRAFLRNITLRESCSNCCFKKKNRVSDLTIADFWGVKEYCPNMYDNKGTSLAFIHTTKGELFFEEISEALLKQVVDFEKAIAYNPSMIESSKVSKYRTVFFKNLDKKNVTKLLKVYTKNRRGIKGLIASFLDKIGLLNVAKKLIKK